MTPDELESISKEPIRSTVHNFWDPIAYRSRRRLIVESPNAGTYGGVIRDESPTVIQTDFLFVDPWIRGHGIGERLMKQLIKEALKLDVETMRGHIESEYALDIRSRIFGEEALKFFYDKPTGAQEDYPEQYDELPITFSEARESLVRAREFEDSLEERSIGFIVEVDILGFKAK